MPGDFRLSYAQRFNKETDTHFIIAHQIEQPEPRVISKGTEQ